MALATPTPPAPSKVAIAAAAQTMKRGQAPPPTPAERAKRGVKIGMEPADPTTRSYKGGVWKNSNGTVVGQSTQEDQQVMPSKSTGDIGPAPQPRKRILPFPKGK